MKEGTTELVKEKKMSNQQKVQDEIDRLKSKRRIDRTSQDKVRLLQLQLYAKAKQEKAYRFYVLYDKVWQLHILYVAYFRVQANGGSPGVDGQDFEEIHQYGVLRFLSELSEELRNQSYCPSAVKRVMIEKEGGGQRGLGIPTIRDRVAQMACKLVIEPIFEADFEDCSYGFRPKRSGSDAMKSLKEELSRGRVEVYDADLSKYFDTIPHDKLLKAVSERVSDPRVLKLLRKWLKAPVKDQSGRYSGGKREQVGTPQGGVISPLLSNIYLDLLDRMITSPKGRFYQAGIRMIRYADDFILMGKELEEWVIQELEKRLDRMGLSLNAQKSKRIKATEEPLYFLGFRVSLDKDIFGRAKKYWNIQPSEKACKKIRQKIKDKLHKIGHYPAAAMVNELNPIIQGWINYFRIEGVSYPQMALRDLDHYLYDRINRYYKRKSQRKCNLYGPQAYEVLTQKYGLKRPYKATIYRPAKAWARTS